MNNKLRWGAHSRVKCNCGHYPKGHYAREGCCNKCGCTWYYPNDKYILRKMSNYKLKFKMRKAIEEDVPFICRLNKRQLGRNCAIWYSTKWIQKIVRGVYPTRYYTLTYNDKPVGAIAFKYSPFAWLTIECFAIQKRYQGKGLGRFAIKQLDKIAKRQKCVSIDVGTYCYLNVTPFYEKLGFEKQEKIFDGDLYYWELSKDLRSI